MSAWDCARCGQPGTNEHWCAWCLDARTPPGTATEIAPRCPVCGEFPLPRARDLLTRTLSFAQCVVCRKRRELPPDAPPPVRGRVVPHGPWAPLPPVTQQPWYWTERRRPPLVPAPMDELIRAPTTVSGDAEVCVACGLVHVLVLVADDLGRELRLHFYGIDLDSLTLPREEPNCMPLHHPLSTREGWAPRTAAPPATEPDSFPLEFAR